jgi:hypothetical protein
MPSAAFFAALALSVPALPGLVYLEEAAYDAGIQ